MTAPFEYSQFPHTRRHGPRGYVDLESFRPWIRDEFTFRCVYCLTREVWGTSGSVFALDHHVPIALRAELALHYDNILYACAPCNLSKGMLQIPNPLNCLLDANVKVRDNGQIHATMPQARKLVEMLGLNRPRMCEFRELWIRIVRLAILFDPALYRRLLAYPNDLPDLSKLRPPEGNARPNGVADSHFARQQRGDLPQTY